MRWASSDGIMNPYPIAEQNLMKIMNDVSYLGAHEEINTVTFDDPELFKYPFAYLIEVGWWTVTDREAAGLRAYLQKGGFLFIDDFKPAGWRGPGGGWEPFARDDAAGAAGRAVFRHAADRSGVPRLLRDQRHRSLPAGLRQRRPGLQGHLRRQRSQQAADGHHQLQHRRLPVLGMVGPRVPSLRSDQRGVQARR